MKKSLLALALAATLSAPAFAAEQYLVRVPANVNLSASEPETPQEPISLSLSAEALPAGTVGEPYSFNLLDRLIITGGSGSHNYSDTAWSLKAGDALPPGLSLSGSMIAGTPTAKNEAGTSFEVTGTYKDASGQQVYTIVVGGQVLRVKQISAGGHHTCAVTTSGAAKCWGYDEYGQIGDGGQNKNQSTPVDVVGLASGVASVSSGNNHTCALMISGDVKCWGRNNFGQLGDGSTNTDKSTPVDVVGLDSVVLSISSGAGSTCVTTTAGGVKCWGYDYYGQLGDGGANTSKNKPVDVVGLTSGVARIDAGDYHFCAVTASGGVKCWGWDGYGQLGDGSTNTNKTTPVDVEGLSSGVSSISAGRIHTCAVHDGAAKCWGSNGYGQIGDGSVNNYYTTPTDVTGLSSGVEGVSVGADHSCALMASGGVKCWGSDIHGQLGNGPLNTNQAVPINVAGLDNAISISSGGYHICVVTTSDSVKCWGSNGHGHLGDGTTTNRTTPVDVLP